MRVVSDSEVFVTPDIESTARNISEWHEIKQRRRAGKESRRRNRKITTKIYLTEIFMGHVHCLYLYSRWIHYCAFSWKSADQAGFE